MAGTGAVSGSAAGTRGVPGVPHVLVVDDEPNIVDLLRTALRFHGFQVTTAATGRAALDAVAADPPDLMILDVMLPDIDGFEVCRSLRSAGAEVPVVYLTARDAHRDKMTGLTYGGDDYVTKPFAVDELVARVRAVLRRTRPVEPGLGGSGAVELTGDGGPTRFGGQRGFNGSGGEGGPRDSRRPVLRFADVEMDCDAHVVTRDGHEIELSPTEFSLLRYLLCNPNRVLSRPQILDAVWTYDFDGESTVVDQYVSYLRRKLGRHGGNIIHTQRGFGYALRQPSGSVT